jgi:DNA invertase Pin-like site-specific DNA recombinase
LVYALTLQRAIGYVRVSTEEQGSSGAGLEAQRRAIRREAKHRGWKLVEIHEDVASGRSMKRRPGLDSAIASLAADGGDLLVVSKLDRLSRSVSDFARFMEDRARLNGWELVVLDLGVDTSTPTGEMFANMMVTLAQWERRIIGERTKDGLAAKRAAGVRLGRPPVLPTAIVRRIRNLRSRGHSLAEIARRLNADGTPTAHPPSRWHAATVKKIVERRRADPGQHPAALS